MEFWYQEAFGWHSLRCRAQKELDCTKTLYMDKYPSKLASAATAAAVFAAVIDDMDDASGHSSGGTGPLHLLQITAVTVGFTDVPVTAASSVTAGFSVLTVLSSTWLDVGTLTASPPTSGGSDPSAPAWAVAASPSPPGKEPTSEMVGRLVINPPRSEPRKPGAVRADEWVA